VFCQITSRLNVFFKGYPFKKHQNWQTTGLIPFLNADDTGMVLKFELAQVIITKFQE